MVSGKLAKIEIDSLRIKIARLQKRLCDLTSSCTHDDYDTRGQSTYCNICSERLGWYCPVALRKYCEYSHLMTHGMEDDECCIHCGEPDERK